MSNEEQMIEKKEVSFQVIEDPYKTRNILSKEPERAEVCSTAYTFNLHLGAKRTRTEECNDLSLTPWVFPEYSPKMGIRKSQHPETSGASYIPAQVEIVCEGLCQHGFSSTDMSPFFHLGKGNHSRKRQGI